MLEDGHEYSRISDRTGGAATGAGSAAGAAAGCTIQYTVGVPASEGSAGSALAYAESK